MRGLGACFLFGCLWRGFLLRFSRGRGRINCVPMKPHLYFFRPHIPFNGIAYTQITGVQNIRRNSNEKDCHQVFEVLIFVS